MGMRATYHLFRPLGKPDVKRAVVEAARKIGAFVRQVDEQPKQNSLTLCEKSGVITATSGYSDGESIFFSEFARELSDEAGCVCFTGRIQEGNHWDYSLSYPSTGLDNFSTQPYYFDHDELLVLSQAGRADMLALAWDLPVESIEDYVIPWYIADPEDQSNTILRPGKAYSTDEFEYGDYNQLFDLLKKLNYSNKPKWFFELRIPRLNFSPKRHFIEDLSIRDLG